MPEKRYLMTPGPTPVPPEVLAALAEPVIHHRGRDFKEIYERCLARLRQVYRTENDVLLFTSSGSGAFESAVSNLVSPGDRILVLSAGNFGERWAAMTKAYGADVVHARLEWGETPDTDDLRTALAEAGDIRVVYLVHSETSTGVVADVQSLAVTAKEAGAVVVVDAVSSLGAVPLETDAWGIDVVVSGSQKALMCPPGLAFVSVSSDALAAAASAVSPRYAFDWERTRAAQAISKIVMAVSRHPARIAIGSVAEVPLRAHRAEAALEGGDVEGAIAAVADDIRPIDDVRSTAAYRRAVTQNVLRGLLDAFARG